MQYDGNSLPEGLDLEPSDRSFRILFSHNPQPMWVYDIATLQFLEVNEAAVAHDGYSRDEFLQMSLSDIQPSEDVPRLLSSVATANTELQASGECKQVLKDGRTIEVQIASHTLDFAASR